MEDAVMVRLIMRTVLLAIGLSFVSANAWADIWTWWRLPQVAIGGGYTSTLIIRDSEGVPSRYVYVYLYDNDGNALKANVGGVGNQISTFNFQLGPNQEKSYALTSTGSLAVGSVQIASYGIGDLNVSLRFTVTDSQGNATDVVGILPVDPNWSWTTSVQKSGSSDLTGVAVQNPWSSTMTVNFDFYQNGARVPTTTTQTYSLSALGHMAIFVDQIFGSTVWSNFSGTGTLRISSSVNSFVAMAIRADGTQYSSLPTEVGAQQWTCTYTDTSGSQPVTYNVTWNWRTYDGWTFTGYEQNSFNADKVRLRGVFASDISDFLAEWNYKDLTDDSRGQTVFMGKIQTGGNTVTGHRIQMKQDGTIVTNVTFTATRVY
jgi:hypothetical protein